MIFAQEKVKIWFTTLCLQGASESIPNKTLKFYLIGLCLYILLELLSVILPCYLIKKHLNIISKDPLGGFLKMLSSTLHL